MKKNDQIIELREIEFSFPGSSVPLFQELNWKIEKGESIALVGANGTGKSTLMKIVATLIRPFKGHYYYKNEELKKNINELRNYINYSAGGGLGFYPRLTAIENLIFFSGLKGNLITKNEACRILTKVNLKEKDFNEKCFKFSLGMKQRLHLAKLILEPSEFIFIDEPTNGLDKEGYVTLIEILNVNLKDKTKVIICHDTSFAQEVTSKIMRIYNGKIFQDNYF